MDILKPISLRLFASAHTLLSKGTESFSMIKRTCPLSVSVIMGINVSHPD
jgi:hypothetical protein